MNSVNLAWAMRFQMLKRRSARRIVWRSDCRPRLTPNISAILLEFADGDVNQLGRRLDRREGPRVLMGFQVRDLESGFTTNK